ncbi:DUF4089 domain-containing protein [Prosthecomicrobium hirschii]|uniref:AtzG-like protein n=1 Tax=Prosthecodimorpha hirschii TaxID=665126 RepID=UPI00112A428A|nr:AtzG-like protein [Prosthecomicrobium hirschii]TPQ50161.1 DUF4089 domain-containing protein [Prosthecomicrobium hirschii]
MNPPAFDAAAHVAHMEKMLGLTIEEAWRPSVVANMAAIAKAAELALSVDIPEDSEPAPVFRP